MNGWALKPIGEDGLLLEVHPGFACGQKDVTGGVPHLRMNNVSKTGCLDMTLVRRVPRDVAESHGRFLQPGDILFNNTNSTELVGKSCLFMGWEERCTFSNHITLLRPNPKQLMPEWLFVCLRELWLRGHFAAHCTEFVGQSAFNKDALFQAKIPLPSLAEQRRLVARIEALTARLTQAGQTRQEAIAEAETLFPKMLATAFSEQSTADWDEYPSNALFKIGSGQVSPFDDQYKHLPYLGPEHIESGTGRIIGARVSVSELKMKSGKHPFTRKDVVYSKIRPALRKVCAPDYAGLCSADMYALRPNLDRINRDFLMYLLLAPSFSEYAVDNSDRNAMPKINQQVLLAFTFRVPKPPEQRRIVCLLRGVQAKQAELHRLQAETDAALTAFTPALLAKAFRGEL